MKLQALIFTSIIVCTLQTMHSALPPDSRMADKIIEAVLSRDPHNVRYLLGIPGGRENINSRGMIGLTPLGTAVQRSYLDMVKLLIDQGADANATMGNGDTALHEAASTKYEDPAIPRALLNAGARTDITNQKGLTALDIAQGKGRFANNPKEAKLIELVAGSPKQDRATLKEAIEQGIPRLVDYLSRRVPVDKADLKIAKDKYQQTHDAVYEEIGKILLDRLALGGTQGLISSSGIAGVYGLPENIAKYIGTFGQKS